jgi:RDD family
VRRPSPATSTPLIALAPLWRRYLASAIDIAIAVVIAVPGTAFFGSLVWVASERDDRVSEWLERSVPRLQKLTHRLERFRAGFVGIGLAEAVRCRNRRSYGQRLMKIRRIDATDGGPVRVKSAIVEYVVAQLVQTAAKQPARLAKERADENLETLKPELRQLGRKHGDDTARYLREGFSLCRERSANPLNAILLGPAAQVAAHIVSTATLPKRQSLSEFAAGIVTTTARSLS